MGYLDHIIISNVKMASEVLKKPWWKLCIWTLFNCKQISRFQFVEHCICNVWRSLLPITQDIRYRNFYKNEVQEFWAWVTRWSGTYGGKHHWIQQKRKVVEMRPIFHQLLEMTFVECCLEKFTRNQIVLGKSCWWFFQLYFNASRSGRSI